MENTKTAIRPATLYRACYGRWESWNDAEMSHAEWDDEYRIFEADDADDAKWIAYTDPIQLKGYQLQMIELLAPVPIDPLQHIDEF